MLYGKLYKKYYPLKSLEDFERINNIDKNDLAKKLSMILINIDSYNIKSYMNGIKNGSSTVRQIVCDKNEAAISEIVERVKNNNILENDIEILNDILYRYKYNKLFSFFVFPVRRQKEQLLEEYI